MADRDSLCLEYSTHFILVLDTIPLLDNNPPSTITKSRPTFSTAFCIRFTINNKVKGDGDGLELSIQARYIHFRNSTL